MVPKSEEEADEAALRYVSDGGMLRDLGLVTDGTRGPRDMAGPELAAAVVRALEQRIAALDKRITLAFRTWNAKGEEVQATGKPDTNEELAAIYERLDRMDTDALREISLNARSAGRLTERIQAIEARLDLAPPDFLTPPPLARAIGAAVLRAAEGIPDRKAEAAKKLDARLMEILDMLGGSAFDRLNAAIVEAKRAGVLP